MTVAMAILVHPDRLDRWDHQDLTEKKANLERTVNPVLKGLQERLDNEANR
jgi:hypothetical protein